MMRSLASAALAAALLGLVCVGALQLAYAQTPDSAAQQAREVTPKKLAAKPKPRPKAQPKKKPRVRPEPKAPGTLDSAPGPSSR
jgi:hypothetical protein